MPAAPRKLVFVALQRKSDPTDLIYSYLLVSPWLAPENKGSGKEISGFDGLPLNIPGPLRVGIISQLENHGANPQPVQLKYPVLLLSAYFCDSFQKKSSAG